MQKLPGIILWKVNYKESYNFPHNTLCKKFRNVLHLYVPLQESYCLCVRLRYIIPKKSQKSKFEIEFQLQLNLRIKQLFWDIESC